MKRLPQSGKRVLALVLLLNVAPFTVLAASAPFVLISHQSKTLPAGAVTPLTKQSSAADTAGSTLTFRRKTIRLVVTTGPDDDMLSYRIAGKRNPTLTVLPKALLQVLFINGDDDMFHDIRFGALPKAFAAQPSTAGTVGSLTLPHRSAKCAATPKAA